MGGPNCPLIGRWFIYKTDQKETIQEISEPKKIRTKRKLVTTFLIFLSRWSIEGVAYIIFMSIIKKLKTKTKKGVDVIEDV